MENDECILNSEYYTVGLDGFNHEKTLATNTQYI